MLYKPVLLENTELLVYKDLGTPGIIGKDGIHFPSEQSQSFS